MQISEKIVNEPKTNN